MWDKGISKREQDMTTKYTIKETAAGWNVYAEGGQLISNHHGRREAENAVRRYQAADKRRESK